MTAVRVSIALAVVAYPYELSVGNNVFEGFMLTCVCKTQIPQGLKDFSLVVIPRATPRGCHVASYCDAADKNGRHVEQPREVPNLFQRSESLSRLEKKMEHATAVP